MSNPSFKAEYKLKQKALKYVLLDDELFKRRQEGLLLRCVNSAEAKRTVYEVHKGICGAHKLGLKMRWIIHRYGYYWPTIAASYVAYVGGLEACQVHGPLQRVSAEELHAIVKPWPFRVEP